MYGHPVRVLNDPLNSISTIYYQGNAVTDTNPLPVSLGDDTITITGDITIPATINVTSSASNPVHVHVTEISVPVSLGSGSNTIGNVNINGIVPVSFCNISIGTYLIKQLPMGSNTIGNVNINGIIPVSLCNLPIGTYLTQQIPAGSNTIGNVNINGILPVSFCNITIGTYLTQQIPTGSNTIGNVNINGIIPVSLCNISIGTYLTRQIPTGSNTIGNVNINGIVPVSLCNISIGTYLTQQIPTGSNTIGSVNINGILPVSFCNITIGTYLTQQIPAGSNTIGSVFIQTNGSNVSTSNPLPVLITNDHLSIGSYTSKGILKVSTPEVVFFNTFQYGIETDIWDTELLNGGTAAFSQDISGVTMTVTNQLNSEVVRQTRNVMKYIPGRQSELTFAVRLTTPVAGIRRRFGLFNGTDGFYFEDNGGDYACVFINSDGGTSYMERIPRANWNGDKLDGFGESKITANAESIQIVTFEYEWYGGGQIIFKFIMNGKSIIIHTFNTANRLPFPWCKTPFLPIRLELKNTTGAAGTHVMYQGSNSLLGQGFTEKIGIAQSILTSLIGYNMAVARTFYPVINIRLKSTNLNGVVIPTFFQIGTLDNTNVFYKILRNATIVGGSWIDMPDTNSFVQYNITSTTAITDGIQLDAGYVATGSGERVGLDKYTQYQIGRSGLGTVSDIITLAVASSSTNKDAVACLTWIEQR